MPSSVTKDPAALLDYGVDWTAWLEGDVISQSTWVVAGPNTSLAIAATPAPVTDGKITRVWLTGGTVDTTYDVTNRVVTVAGRIDERTLKVAIRQK